MLLRDKHYARSYKGNMNIRTFAGVTPAGLVEQLADLPEAINSRQFSLLKAAPDYAETALAAGDGAGRPLPANFWAIRWKRLVLESNGRDRYILKIRRPASVTARLWHSATCAYSHRLFVKRMRDFSQRRITFPRLIAAGGAYSPGGLLNFSFTVSEKVTGMQTLDCYLARLLACAKTTTAVDEVVRYVGYCLADAHRCGFYHRDMKPCHLLLPAESDFYRIADSTLGSLVWLDLEDAAVNRSVCRRRRIKNLAQVWRYLLQPLAADRLPGFIFAYGSRCRLSGAESRRLEQAVIKRYRYDLARAYRRGKLLATDPVSELPLGKGDSELAKRVVRLFVPAAIGRGASGARMEHRSDDEAGILRQGRADATGGEVADSNYVAGL